MRSNLWIVLLFSAALAVFGAGLLGVAMVVSSAGHMASPPAVAAAPPSYAYVPVLTLFLPDGIGDSPRAFAANPVTGLVYTANFESDDVSVVSGTRFLATVYGGSRPFALAADPSTGYIYVLDGWADEVQVLSGTARVGTVPLPAPPKAVAVDTQRGYGYVLQQGNEIAVLRGSELITTVRVPTTSGTLNDIAVNPASGLLYAPSDRGWGISSTVVIVSGTAVVAEVPLPGLISQHIAIDPLQGYAYVANGLQPSVTILNGTAVITTITMLSQPWQIAVDPARGLAYVRCSDQVSVLSGTQRLGDVDTQPYGTPTLQVEPESGYAYVILRALDESHRLLVLQGTSEVARIPLAEGSMVMGVDGRGSVYLAHWSGLLSVWKDTALVGRIPSRASPAAFLGDPARGYTYIANGDGSDTVTVVSGTEIVANLPVGYGPVQLAAMPQRDLTYVVSKEVPGISVLRGSELLATVPVSLSSPSEWRNPHLAVEPQRGWAYAAFSWQSGIYVFSETALLTTIPITKVYDLAVDPLTGNLLVCGLDYQGLVVISGTEVISHVVMPWYIEHLAADPQSGYVYAASYYEWWALRNGEPIQSMGNAPDQMLVQPYSGLLYAQDDTILTIFSGTDGLASADLGFSWPYDTYGDAGSDRFTMLYDWAEPGMAFQVWRGTERVAMQSGLTYFTQVGSSPGGAYLYLTPARGISGDHLEVWREVALSYRFYLPQVDR